MSKKIVSFLLLTVLCVNIVLLSSSRLLHSMRTGADPASSNPQAAFDLFATDSSSSNPSFWPMFHNGLDRNGYSTSEAPDTNQTRWAFTAGDKVISSPAVFSGGVFFGSEDSKVYALDAATGAQIWNYTTGSLVDCSPAFYNNTLYVGSYDGYVYALYWNGSLRWKHSAGDAIFSSPAVLCGAVIEGSGKRVYALNASTGSEIWNYTTGGEIDSSPAVSGDCVYIGSMDNKVYCLNVSTGAEIWNYSTGAGVFSSPAIAEGRVYAASFDSRVYCLDAIAGSLIWSYQTSGPVRCSPAVAYGMVFVGSTLGDFYALNASTSSLIWNYTTGGWIDSSPAIADDKVYVGSFDNKTYAFDAHLGILLWSYKTNGRVRSSPAIADNCVYVGSEDGKLYAFGYIIVPDDYPTIQDAVNAANPGDTIFVRDGTYDEAVFVGKSGIHLLGESKSATVIDATDIPSTYSAVVTVCSDSVEISGFTFQSTYEFTCVYMINSSCSRCRIGENIMDSVTRFGVVSYGNHTTVMNNVIHSWDTGIILNGSNYDYVDSNSIDKGISGIVIYSSESNIVSNNRMLSPTNGMVFSSAHDNTMVHNSFLNNSNPAVFITFGLSNIWDAGYPSGGNYWSNYHASDSLQGQYQNLPGSDGVGDTPYVIDSNDTDHYPLVAPTFSDVQVSDVTAPMVSPSGITMAPLSATVKNTGDETRSLDVTFYANDTKIGGVSITIPAMSSMTCTLPWNTIGQKGNYQLTAYIGQPLINRPITMPKDLPPPQAFGAVRIFAMFGCAYHIAWVKISDSTGKAVGGGDTTTTPGNPLIKSLAPGTYKIEGYQSYEFIQACGPLSVPQTTYVTVKPNSVVDAYLHFQKKVLVQGPGYWIIVAGSRDDGELDDVINDGCNQVYRILREVGYDKGSIYYLCQQKYLDQDIDGDGRSEPSGLASLANIKSAIRNVARWKCSDTEPLFIYMFDHGDTSGDYQHGFFCVNEVVTPFGGEIMDSAWLKTEIEWLKQQIGCQVHTIIACCHSGAFIPDLSEPDDITVTCCTADQAATPDGNGKWEVFSEDFWHGIESGLSVLDAFNHASSSTGGWWGFPGRGLLDDNRDGVGHTATVGGAISGFGLLPKDGDGYLAGSTHIGACEWPYPWIRQVGQCLNFSWPPPGNVTLWAKIENKTALTQVTARMVPPDWAPSNSSNTLVKLGTESFAMADPDHDGNWTVNIPAVNFTNHASGPSNFTFFIAAEEQNGDSATNVPVNVRFTETGMLPPDNLSPQVLIDRPLEGRVYSGSINVNGTAADDVCLDKAEVYVDGTLQGTVYLTSVSTSFFDVGLNTNLLPNGNNTIFVKTYDKAGNNNNQTIVFYVQNSIHDVSVTGMVTDKTVVGLAWASDINVTVANIGSIQESFNLSIYANATCIANTSVNLSSQNFSTLTLRSSTTNLTYGTYILTAYASLVSGENNTANNVLTQTAIAITIPGDINGDFKVSLADLVLLANAYGSTPGNAKWNPNADINGNNKADLADLVLMANHYGQHYP